MLSAVESSLSSFSDEYDQSLTDSIQQQSIKQECGTETLTPVVSSEIMNTTEEEQTIPSLNVNDCHIYNIFSKHFSVSRKVKQSAETRSVCSTFRKKKQKASIHSSISTNGSESQLPVHKIDDIFNGDQIKVFLEDGSLEEYRFHHETTAKEIVLKLAAKLQIKCVDRYRLTLTDIREWSVRAMHYIRPCELLTKIKTWKEVSHSICGLRLVLLPKDSTELIHTDSMTFRYLYRQCINDFLRERYGSDVKLDLSIRLTSLLILDEAICKGGSHKLAVKLAKKSLLLKQLLPRSIIQKFTLKELKKQILAQLWTYHTTLLKRPSQLEVATEYLRLFSQIRTYGGKLFPVKFPEKHQDIILLVGPYCGVAALGNLRSNTIMSLIDFEHLTSLQIKYWKNGLCIRLLASSKCLHQDVSFLIHENFLNDFIVLTEGYYSIVNYGQQLHIESMEIFPTVVNQNTQNIPTSLPTTNEQQYESSIPCSNIFLANKNHRVSSKSFGFNRDQQTGAELTVYSNIVNDIDNDTLQSNSRLRFSKKKSTNSSDSGDQRSIVRRLLLPHKKYSFRKLKLYKRRSSSGDLVRFNKSKDVLAINKVNSLPLDTNSTGTCLLSHLKSVSESALNIAAKEKRTEQYSPQLSTCSKLSKITSPSLLSFTKRLPLFSSKVLCLPSPSSFIQQSDNETISNIPNRTEMSPRTGQIFERLPSLPETKVQEDSTYQLSSIQACFQEFEREKTHSPMKSILRNTAGTSTTTTWEKIGNLSDDERTINARKRIDRLLSTEPSLLTIGVTNQYDHLNTHVSYFQCKETNDKEEKDLSHVQEQQSTITNLLTTAIGKQIPKRQTHIISQQQQPIVLYRTIVNIVDPNEQQENIYDPIQTQLNKYFIQNKGKNNYTSQMEQNLSLANDEEDDDQPDVIDLTTSCAYWGTLQFPVRPPDAFADNESMTTNTVLKTTNISRQLEEDESGFVSGSSGSEKNDRSKDAIRSSFLKTKFHTHHTIRHPSKKLTVEPITICYPPHPTSNLNRLRKNNLPLKQTLSTPLHISSGLELELLPSSPPPPLLSSQLPSPSQSLVVQRSKSLDKLQYEITTGNLNTNNNNRTTIGSDDEYDENIYSSRVIQSGTFSRTLDRILKRQSRLDKYQQQHPRSTREKLLSLFHSNKTKIKSSSKLVEIDNNLREQNIIINKVDLDLLEKSTTTNDKYQISNHDYKKDPIESKLQFGKQNSLSSTDIESLEIKSKASESVKSTLGVVLGRVQNESHGKQTKSLTKLNHNDVPAVIRRNSLMVNSSSNYINNIPPPDYDLTPKMKTKKKYTRSKTADILISYESSIKNVQLLSQTNSEDTQPSIQRKNGITWVTLKRNSSPIKSTLNLTENVYETPIERQSSSSSDSFVENKQSKKKKKNSTIDRLSSLSTLNSSTSSLSSIDDTSKKINSTSINEQENILNGTNSEKIIDTSTMVTNRRRSPLNDLRNIIRRMRFKNHKTNKDFGTINVSGETKTSIKNHLQKQRIKHPQIQIVDVEQKFKSEPLKAIHDDLPISTVIPSPPIENDSIMDIELELDKIVLQEKNDVQNDSRYNFGTNTNDEDVFLNESWTSQYTTVDDRRQEYQRKGGLRKHGALSPRRRQQLRVHWHDGIIDPTATELEQILNYSLDLCLDPFESSNEILIYLQYELQLKLDYFYSHSNSPTVSQDNENLDETKKLIESQCRQFVSQSKLFVNGATESIDDAKKHLATCTTILIDLYRLLNKYTSVANDNEESIELLKCTIHFIQVFKSCVHLAKLAAGKPFYDQNMRMLMRQTSALAQALNDLLKRLNNYKKY